MDMVEALTKDEQVFPKAHQFKSLINHACLQKVASKQFDKTLKEHSNKASMEVCPAISKWFILGPEKLNDEWQQWLFDEIEKALPVSLRYAAELYHFWYDPKRNRDGKLRAKVVDASKKIYESNPALLTKVLDPDYIWSVFDFTDNFMEKNDDGRFSINQWSWLGHVLLEASNIDPLVIGVHIVPMLCYYPAYNRERGIEFNDKFQQQDLEQIFSGNVSAVMKSLLFEGIDIEKYDEQSKKVLYRAQAEAEKWLNQNNSNIE